MLTATEIKDGIDKAVKKHENDTPPASGVIASLFGKVLVGQTKGGVDAIRHVVCEYLVGEVSTKKMSEGQLCALSRWLTGDPQAFFGAELRDGIAGEMQRVYDAAMEAQGQVELPRPDMCWVCEGLEIQYQTYLDDVAEMPDLGVPMVIDDGTDLKAHRATCDIWKAAHPVKTEADMKRELGY